jgi:hypothetical protein
MEIKLVSVAYGLDSSAVHLISYDDVGGGQLEC